MKKRSPYISVSHPFTQLPSFLRKVHKSFSAVLLQEHSSMTKKYHLYMALVQFFLHSVSFFTCVVNVYMHVFHLIFPYSCYFHFHFYKFHNIFQWLLNSRLPLLIRETTEKKMFKTHEMQIDSSEGGYTFCWSSGCTILCI